MEGRRFFASTTEKETCQVDRRNKGKKERAKNEKFKK